MRRIFFACRDLLFTRIERQAYVFCLRSGLWYFIEVIQVPLALDQIAHTLQLAELIVVGGAWHSDLLRNSSRGGRKAIIILVGSKVDVQKEGMCTEGASGNLPVIIVDP